MLTRDEINAARSYAQDRFRDAGIVITAEEAAAIEVSDFGLGDLLNTGLQLIVYINTERVCAKDIVLRPHQTCPEHQHVDSSTEQGKEETFRVRAGTVYLYVDGEPAAAPHCHPSRAERGAYTVWHEIVMNPGDQYTIYPGTRHWFQAGDDGAIVSEFSTRSTDSADVFTDPDITRITVVAD
jgi:D-lyxose ketol-isomerase